MMACILLCLLLLLCIQQRSLLPPSLHSFFASLLCLTLSLSLYLPYLFRWMLPLRTCNKVSFVSSTITHATDNNNYFVLFFKSTFTRRSCPSVPLHGRTQRSGVECRCSNWCNRDWVSLLVLDDRSDLFHATSLIAFVWPVGLLCVWTRRRHHTVGIGLCTMQGGSTPKQFSTLKINVCSLKFRGWIYLVFLFFFPIFLQLREQGLPCSFLIILSKDKF